MEDASGELAITATVIGVAVGGIIGGVCGAAAAFVKGESVLAGAAIGAITGAGMSFLCSWAVATYAISWISIGISSFGCATIAGAGNLANQTINYMIDSQDSSGTDADDAFSIDWGSVTRSACSAAIAAPLATALSGALGSVFPEIVSGVDDILGIAIANAATTGNISILQSIVELF